MMIPVFLTILLACGGSWAQAMADAAVKNPGVAGGFYAADPKELAGQIDGFIQNASAPADRHVDVAIAPHAGYIYSGPVAGHTFKAISKNTYTTVIVIGPSHFYPFSGAAIWPSGGFKTPLGTLPIDETFAKALLAKTPVVQERKDVFSGEHAVEVELPFVQKVFGAVKIVPLLMGQPDFKACESLAMAINELIGSRQDVLVLISSDMSHYHAYDAANSMDAGTLAALQRQDIEGFWNGVVSGKMEMCGFVPVTVGMMIARLRGDTAAILKYENSGDTAGDKAKVVGYGSAIFYRPDSTVLTAQEKKYLLLLARNTIETFVKTGRTIDVQGADARLSQVQGAFVTITKKGQLRGCIGTIIGQEPLALTVRDMAIAAASQDPRFARVSADELKDIDVEISVLSPPVRAAGADAIVLGRDGVIVNGQGGQGVFLPQVAKETGWSKEEFLSELCSQKAGLARDCWKSPDVALYTFTADVFGDTIFN